MRTGTALDRAPRLRSSRRHAPAGHARLARRDRARAASIRRRSARSCSAVQPPPPDLPAERRDHVRHDRDRQRRRLRRRPPRRRRGAHRRRRGDPRPRTDAAALRTATAPTRSVDGWFATGDLGRWLDDGRLHVDGRRGDLIITGGENVWPEPVEAVLRQLPRSPTSPWRHSRRRVGPGRHGLRGRVRTAPPTLDELRARRQGASSRRTALRAAWCSSTRSRAPRIGKVRRADAVSAGARRRRRRR